ncbi:Hypothetical predicted protein [Mytilus galloprovincialis]|uniref:Uncharacterized protein n=1 Tax=Mytilus galloprovincialis TaxID=29158 RepID=A0A8B6FIV1_MYTGA|nr:Hypothetical predicted protein [Mytilus galloprovincialis]
MLNEHSQGVQMVPRENTDFTFAYGILPNSNVQLRDKKNRKGIGSVQHLIRKKTESVRSSALVEWIDYSKKRYCVGGKGKCDLKFTKSKAAKGPKYYEDHLPFIESKNAKIGTRVVNCLSKVRYIGTIVELNSFVTIQWDYGTSIQYSFPCSTVRVFDNGPAGERTLEKSNLRCFVDIGRRYPIDSPTDYLKAQQLLN